MQTTKVQISLCVLAVWYIKLSALIRQWTFLWIFYRKPLLQRLEQPVSMRIHLNHTESSTEKTKVWIWMPWRHWSTVNTPRSSWNNVLDKTGPQSSDAFYMSPVKRICVFEHSVMTNYNCACPAIQRCQGSGFLSEGSSWLTAYMSEQRRFWRDCTDAQARLNLRCSHRL